MAKKRVLVLNGSFCEAPIIKKAKEMGMYVITTGNAPNLIGHQYADEYIPADYSDKEKVLQIVKDNDIEGVISCANDFGVLTAAYVAEQMGWPGHDKYEIAKLLHILPRSFRMRRCRLKKKMKIDCDSLPEFIKRLFKSEI